jgi:hypothetical protein
VSEVLPRCCCLDELAALVRDRPGLHVRYSRGPDHDRARTSCDHESGLELPGLSVNPLDAPEWWTREAIEWIARKLCQYAHLRDGAPEERVAWVLQGELAGRGPDNEPLLSPWSAVATLDAAVIDEARALYERRFDIGRDSTG